MSDNALLVAIVWPLVLVAVLLPRRTRKFRALRR
jgi:hypothetical protein